MLRRIGRRPGPTIKWDWPRPAADPAGKGQVVLHDHLRLNLSRTNLSVNVHKISRVLLCVHTCVFERPSLCTHLCVCLWASYVIYSFFLCVFVYLSSNRETQTSVQGFGNLVVGFLNAYYEDHIQPVTESYSNWASDITSTMWEKTQASIVNYMPFRETNGTLYWSKCRNKPCVFSHVLLFCNSSNIWNSFSIWVHHADLWECWVWASVSIAVGCSWLYFGHLSSQTVQSGFSFNI